MKKRETLKLIGKKFNSWEILSLEPKAKFRVKCECGIIKLMRRYYIINGVSKCCGCKKRTKTPEHAAWVNMKQRCFNKNHPQYLLFGGRGITVCERWLDYELFLLDMGKRPADHRLARKDIEDNYTPNNCYWAPDKGGAWCSSDYGPTDW